MDGWIAEARLVENGGDGEQATKGASEERLGSGMQIAAGNADGWIGLVPRTPERFWHCARPAIRVITQSLIPPSSLEASP